MKKVVLACALAAVSLSSMAQIPLTEHGRYEVKLMKDGKERVVGVTALNAPVPFTYRSGQEVSEVSCIQSDQAVTMQSKPKFVGVALDISRRTDDPGQADVTVEDENLLNMEKVSEGDCASLIAKTDGLPSTKLAVRLPRDNETLNVPVDGGRYVLQITHRID